MDKVRFACPRCQTLMQTQAEKVGHDVACPHCSHRFRLVEPEPSIGAPTRTDLSDGIDFGLEATNDRPVDKIAVPGATNSFGATKGFAPVATSSAFRPVGFQCPYCQTTRSPIMRSEISQMGWLVFVVLLVTTCFGCVVGFFIRDKYRECSQCKIRLG